jgi:hypothetical protein
MFARSGRGRRGALADAGCHCTGKSIAAYELDVDACGTVSDITSQKIPSLSSNNFGAVSPKRPLAADAQERREVGAYRG